MDISKAKYVDVNGINTRYFEAGSGEPMVLIHGAAAGNSSSAEVWSKNFDTFAEKYHVYAFDKLGQGYTDNPKINEDYFMGGQVKHAAEFMETLGISNAHLIGHSRGGYMVTRMALEYPDLAKSIVIIDSATLMENISFYEEVAQRAKSISDPKEKVHYSMSHNSYGTDHITDEWIKGILDYTSSNKFKEAQDKAQELYPAFLQDLSDWSMIYDYYFDVILWKYIMIIIIDINLSDLVFYLLYLQERQYLSFLGYQDLNGEQWDKNEKDN